MVRLKFPVLSKLLVATAGQLVSDTVTSALDSTRNIPLLVPPVPKSAMPPDTSAVLVIIN